jgi:hypothetical protein
MYITALYIKRIYTLRVQIQPVQIGRSMQTQFRYMEFIGKKKGDCFRSYSNVHLSHIGKLFKLFLGLYHDIDLFVFFNEGKERITGL